MSAPLKIPMPLRVPELVGRRAQQAKAAGIHGLILSAEEVKAMRCIVGPNMLLVTPGIRPAGAAIGDQKRVMTPARAIAAGANHLVIGRPVTQSPDPRAAAQAIVAEIAAAGGPLKPATGGAADFVYNPTRIQ